MSMKAKKVFFYGLIMMLLTFQGIVGTKLSWNKKTYAASSYEEKYQAFINDDRWKNGIGWGGSQGPKLSGWSSSGCCAYCADFEKYVYGTQGWSGSAFYSVADIKAGDILHVSPEHWFVVLNRNGNNLYTAEGNCSSKVVVSNSRYTISGNSISYTSGSGPASFSLVVGYHYDTGTTCKPVGTPLDLGQTFDATLTDASGKSICCRDDGKLQMGSYTYAERSKYVWNFEKQSDGSYKVTSWSGNSMDCAGAGTANGTTIQVYEWNGSNAQKYYIYDVGNGKIVLEPACARGSVIDKGGSDNCIHLWEYSSNNDNQMFTLQISAKASLDTSFDAKIMVSNTDEKKTALYLDSNGDVINKNLTNLNDADNDRYLWHFEKNSDGSYVIKNLYNNLVLDCCNWGTENGTRIQTYDCNGTTAQKWNIYDVSGERYVIEPQCSPGRVADIGGTNGSLHLWHYTDENANQRFLLITDNPTELPIEESPPKADSLSGDLNGDGMVNSTDVILLRRYLAGGYGNSVNEKEADVNADGKLNATDVILIRRYIAGGYGVELKTGK